MIQLDYTQLVSASGPGGAENLSKKKIPTGFSAAEPDSIGRLIPPEGAVFERLGPRCAANRVFMDYGASNKENTRKLVESITANSCTFQRNTPSEKQFNGSDVTNLHSRRLEDLIEIGEVVTVTNTAQPTSWARIEAIGYARLDEEGLEALPQMQSDRASPGDNSCDLRKFVNSAALKAKLQATSGCHK